MLGVILQVSGAILLAKGLLFRKELDLVLKIYTLMKNIDKKATRMMEYYYTEWYVSLIGVSWLVLGYFLPLVGIEIRHKTMEELHRLIIGICGIVVLVYFSIKVADYLGKQKAEKTSEEFLLEKYSIVINENGYYITGMSDED